MKKTIKVLFNSFQLKYNRNKFKNLILTTQKLSQIQKFNCYQVNCKVLIFNIRFKYKRC